MQTMFAYTSFTSLCNHFSSDFFNCFSTTQLTMISCTQKNTISEKNMVLIIKNFLFVLWPFKIWNCPILTAFRRILNSRFIKLVSTSSLLECQMCPMYFYSDHITILKGHENYRLTFRSNTLNIAIYSTHFKLLRINLIALKAGQ